MTTWQKIIKYGAILLAFFLIFQIIFLILWGFRLFGSFLGLYDEEEVCCVRRRGMVHGNYIYGAWIPAEK